MAGHANMSMSEIYKIAHVDLDCKKADFWVNFLGIESKGGDLIANSYDSGLF